MKSRREYVRSVVQNQVPTALRTVAAGAAGAAGAVIEAGAAAVVGAVVEAVVVVTMALSSC